MITQLNDSIWALNKKSVRLTGISDRFKVFVQKLEHAYPDINIFLNEEIDHDRLLSPFQALHLFRIMQEALNNALRHSKCRTVNINLVSDEKLLQVSIVDDGIGMHNVNLNGNGINNLKARAKESGWNAEWLNNPEAGTSVIISTSPIEINTTN
jgi:signal transduction histidine kinase